MSCGLRVARGKSPAPKPGAPECILEPQSRWKEPLSSSKVHLLPRCAWLFPGPCSRRAGVQTCSSVPARRARRKRKSAVCRAGILSSDRALGCVRCSVLRIWTCCNSPPPGDTLGTAREVRPAPARPRRCASLLPASWAPPSQRRRRQQWRRVSGARGPDAACRARSCAPGLFFGLGERELQSFESDVSDFGGAV